MNACTAPCVGAGARDARCVAVCAQTGAGSASGALSVRASAGAVDRCVAGAARAIPGALVTGEGSVARCRNRAIIEILCAAVVNGQDRSAARGACNGP